jgi:hypothetical protein
MDKVRLHREILKKAWFSLPRDKNKLDYNEVIVELSSGKVKYVQDLANYYASQERFEGFFALFKAIKYKFSKKNCKLIIRL